MHFSLTSISGNALTSDQFEQAIITTWLGTITILPGHEPLITALSPGVAVIKCDWVEHRYALGGWVAEITPTSVRILADMIEDGGHDLGEIATRKANAEAAMNQYRAGQSTMTMEEFVELEQDYLRDTAREQLATK